jgi:hypothetical protein
MMRASFDYRDYEMVPKPQSVYHKIFGADRDYVVRKARYRGVSGAKLHLIPNLSREEAKHFLLHDRHGRQLQRDFPNIPLDQLADHVVEASGMTPTNKREVAMNNLVEVCKGMNAGDCAPPTEHELTEQIQKYASEHRRDGETAVGAFNRILTGDDDIGLTFRKSLAVCKRATGFPV